MSTDNSRRDPAEEFSPATRGCLSLVCLACGMALLIITAVLWDDVSNVSRILLLLLAVLAVALSIWALLAARRDEEADRDRRRRGR
jgi:protein-S-isoprenylcysteine O-methyltransferase Ste14